MAANMCMQNCSEPHSLAYEAVAAEIWPAQWTAAVEYLMLSPWLFSLLGSTMVGLTGIFPLLVIPIEEGADLKSGASAGTLKILLSFAVGGLLGDVFLHLLPEALENDLLRKAQDAGHPTMTCGLWVLSGFLVFVILEKIFAFESEPEDAEPQPDDQQNQLDSSHAEKEMENNNCIPLVAGNPKNGLSKRLAKTEFSKVMTEVQPFLERKPTKDGYGQPPNGYKDSHKNGFVKPVLACPHNDDDDGITDDRLIAKSEMNGLVNGYQADRADKVERPPKQTKKKHITGYLNLMANVIDNFTHGLAVGGSFLVSFRLGTLTTFAILIHEIPHEVGDFAILLRSGFNRWDAARAQLLTASGGIFGAMCAVFFSGGVEARTSWILPFTAGGFLHIGMVTILPDLLKEPNPKESLKQLAALLLGIVVMALLTLCD